MTEIDAPERRARHQSGSRVTIFRLLGGGPAPSLRESRRRGYHNRVISSLRPGHASRYAALARLLLKHRGAAAAAAAAGTDLDLDGYSPGEDAATEEDARELVDQLIGMGPTFVKLGQLLSTRADLLPPVYLDALSQLRDDVAPLEPGEAERVVEEELGVRISKAFGSFDRRPIGAASLGQVHRATLRDGRPVAVKVQRPGIRGRALEDMEVISELAEFLDSHSERAYRFGFGSMVEQFRRSLIGELDYRREAANLRMLGEKLAHYEAIVVPQPVEDYTTSKVLTMDMVDGRSISSVGPLGRMELDGKDLADQLLGAYLEQVLVHGFFHADPHPGNVLLTSDHRLALVDLGMVARLSPDVQEQLLRLLLAVSVRDAGAAAEALERLCERVGDYDAEGLRSRVADVVLRYGSSTLGQLAAGRLVGELAVAASACGLRARSELTMLAKTLLDLDEVARTLDPDIQVDKIIEAHAAQVMRHRMMEAARPARMMRSALDAAAFAEELPNRLNKVLEALSEGRLNLRLEGLDEKAMLRGAQKLANRVATGVLIAAFVVAAALFSSGRSGVTVWGYPLLTIVFLGLALITAGWLGVVVMRGDLPQRGRRG